MQPKSFSFDLPDEYSTQAKEIQRRQQWADMLQQQAQTPLEMNRMAGGYVVPIHPMEGLAKLMAGMQARSERKGADEQSVKLAQLMQTNRADTLQRAMQAGQGVAPVAPTNSDESFGLGNEGVAPNPANARQVLSQSKDPMMQQLAMQMLMKDLEPQKPVTVGRSLVDPRTGKVVGVDSTWKEEQDATRASREADAEARRTEQRTRDEKERDFRKELETMRERARVEFAQIAAGLRPPAQPRQIQLTTDDQGNQFVVNPDGTTRPLTDATGKPMKGARGANQHLTEGEAKGTIFHNQMASAEKQIADITKNGKELPSPIASRMARSDWFNWASPEKAQQYQQAAEQWAEAYLRIKTGAATNRDEIVRNSRTYFPQPGDSQAVIEQKNSMREGAIRDVSVMAGRGLQQTPQTGGASGGWSGPERRSAPTMKFDKDGNPVK